MQNKTAVHLVIIATLIFGIGAGTAKEGAITEGIIISAIGIVLAIFSYSSYIRAMKKL